jgi:hypothetical protein
MRGERFDGKVYLAAAVAGLVLLAALVMHRRRSAHRAGSTPVLVLAEPPRHAVASLSLPWMGSGGPAGLFTVETLRGWGLDRLTAVASLVATEFVTNAFLHAGTGVTVELHNLGGGVRITVRDGAPIRGGDGRSSAQGTSSGRGLELVNVLASDWGVEPAGTGKVVWALIIEDPAEGHDDGRERF